MIADESCNLAIGSEIYCKGEQTNIVEAEDQEIEQPKLDKGDDSMREKFQVVGKMKQDMARKKKKMETVYIFLVWTQINE